MGPLMFKGCMAFLYPSKVKLELVPTIKTKLRKEPTKLQWSFGWRLMTEIELGLTKEQRKVLGPFGCD